MAEPTATSAGISLTVLSVAFLGPTLGPYALIAFAALAGTLWPLLADDTSARVDPSVAEHGRQAALRIAGAWLVLRCTITAVVLTVFISGLIERLWSIPALESLAPVAFLIGALGNGWRPVFGGIADALRLALNRIGGGGQ